MASCVSYLDICFSTHSSVRVATRSSLNAQITMKYRPLNHEPRLSLSDLICPYAVHHARNHQTLEPRQTISCCPSYIPSHKHPPLRSTHWTVSLDSRLLEALITCSRSHSHLPSSAVRILPLPPWNTAQPPSIDTHTQPCSPPRRYAR